MPVQVSGRSGWMTVQSDELRKQLKETAATKVIDSIHVKNWDGVKKDLNKIHIRAICVLTSDCNRYPRL
jgi:hypothetical protein